MKDTKGFVIVCYFLNCYIDKARNEPYIISKKVFSALIIFQGKIKAFQALIS